MMNWSSSLKETKDREIRKMYLDYISYFENIDIRDHLFDPLWYDFDELINTNFLKMPLENLENVVHNVRDILWEIIAFKTDRECKVLPIDNLRLLTDKNRANVFFCCDVCGYIENIAGEKFKNNDILFPATNQQILEYKVCPARY